MVGGSMALQAKWANPITGQTKSKDQTLLHPDLQQFTSAVKEGTVSYRFDQRFTGVIRRSGGMKPEGDNWDMVNHLTSNKKSVYVSSSQTFDAALNFANQKGGDGYIYVVRNSQSTRAVDYSAELPLNPTLIKTLSQEKELIHPYGIQNSDILGSYRVYQGSVADNLIPYNK